VSVRVSELIFPVLSHVYGCGRDGHRFVTTETKSKSGLRQRWLFSSQKTTIQSLNPKTNLNYV